MLEAICRWNLYTCVWCLNISCISQPGLRKKNDLVHATAKLEMTFKGFLRENSFSLTTWLYPPQRCVNASCAALHWFALLALPWNKYRFKVLFFFFFCNYDILHSCSQLVPLFIIPLTSLFHFWKFYVL